MRPLFVYGVWSSAPDLGRIREGLLYMKANNAGKVSNLIVAPHRNILLTTTTQKGGPLLASLAPLHGGYLTHINELAAGDPMRRPIAFNTQTVKPT